MGTLTVMSREFLFSLILGTSFELPGNEKVTKTIVKRGFSPPLLPLHNNFIFHILTLLLLA
jgi:hypothetical protein